MQRDYIMRLIEQIAALLASVIAKERAGEFSEAKTDLEEKARQTIGMSLADLRRLSPEAVTQLLESSGGLRYGRAVILAELLLHDAALLEVTNENSDAVLNYLHAFCLLSEAMETLTDEDQAVYRPKLQELLTRLRRLPVNPYLEGKLAQYGVDA
jgi:hypothetical protein